MNSQIIEESENTKLERIATVQTPRGDMLINLDRAAIMLAELIHERDHEVRMGWNLQPAWYQDAFERLAEYAEDRPSSASPHRKEG